MDFFERQAIAKRHTKLLTVYFALAVAAIVVTTYLAVVVCVGSLKEYSQSRSSNKRYGNYETGSGFVLWDPKLFGMVTLGTLGVIFCGSMWKTSQLSDGGSAVAEMLGGRPIESNTTNPDERKLLNVVEEMAIASGTPVPQVFVLPDENGINAFAAGHTTGDMAVCATRGCLKYLSRDELQGVIGHEFSHILNGDMRLNLRLMGLIFGILCITVFGRILLRVRGNSRDKNPLPLLGLALIIIGFLGVFFARLIKSAVSRQREFLADAASVQFTRNPEGLAGALKKVGGYGSHIDDAQAEEASHFFFANGMYESFSNAFSTHPPLEERIRALEPRWDGKFIAPKPEDFRDEAGGEDIEEGMAEILGGKSRRVRPPVLGDLLGGGHGGLPVGPATIVAAGLMAQAGTPTAQHLEYAADLRANMPAALSGAARDPMSAVALIYALLLSKEDGLREQQLKQLQAVIEPPIFQEVSKLLPEAMKLDSRGRLPLASLSMTALRSLSPAQYAQFSKAMRVVVESDGQIELFEYVLQKIVTRQLESNYVPPRKQTVQFYALRGLEPECATVLSALACAGQDDIEGIGNAFRRGAATLQLDNIILMTPEQCGLDKVDFALERLNLATPQIKKVVLYACAETVAADGVIQETEAELLRAIAETLDCPIPPILKL